MKPRASVPGCLLIGLVTCLALTGCNRAGPLSIDEGRMRYNDVIEQTTQTQFLLNLVRTSQNRAPLFIEVTEVDASLTFSGALSSALSGLGIGKKGGVFRTGSLISDTVVPAVGYAENPTIRYIPLQGQALIQQLAASISIDSLPQLYDADLPLPTLLNFTVDRLTPEYNDYGAALNIIGQLDFMAEITIAATAVHADDSTGPPSGASQKATTIVQTVPPAMPRHTALMLYLQPNGLSCSDTLVAARLWTQLLEIYATVRTEAENAHLKELESLLASIRGCEGESLALQPPGHFIAKQAVLAALHKVPSLELRTEALKDTGDSGRPTHISNLAPFLKMRSAYAIFRSIEVSDYSPTELVEIVTPAAQATIAGMPWNDGQQFHLFTFQQYCQPNSEINPQKCNELRQMYESQPASVREEMDRRICQHGRHITVLAERKPKDERLQDELHRWTQICGRYTFANAGIADPTVFPSPLLTMSEDDMSGPTSLTPQRRMEERLLRKQRRYILIVSAPDPPVDTFVSVEVDGTYYYVAKDDTISQKNFRLLQLLSIIQAVAPVAPLTPTVSVGGH